MATLLIVFFIISLWALLGFCQLVNGNSWRGSCRISGFSWQPECPSHKHGAHLSVHDVNFAESQWRLHMISGCCDGTDGWL